MESLPNEILVTIFSLLDLPSLSSLSRTNRRFRNCCCDFFCFERRLDTIANLDWRTYLSSPIGPHAQSNFYHEQVFLLAHSPFSLRTVRIFVVLRSLFVCPKSCARKMLCYAQTYSEHVPERFLSALEDSSDLTNSPTFRKVGRSFFEILPTLNLLKQQECSKFFWYQVLCECSEKQILLTLSNLNSSSPNLFSSLFSDVLLHQKIFFFVQRFLSQKFSSSSRKLQKIR